MPGPYIHISAMRHAAADLSGGGYRPVPSDRIDPGWNGEDVTELGRILGALPNFAALGAVGPDLFFFLPDFRDKTIEGVRISLSSVLVKVLQFLEDLYAAIDPYLTKWEHYLGPASEGLGEEMSRLTGGLSEVLGGIFGELNAILTTAIEDFFVKQRDWWSFFSLGFNEGTDEQAFFWSDMLHYRRTGAFGRSLLRHAQALGDDRRDGARAYALGYLTHLATDVSGHALVNAISGGPFRLHWQRHHLVENHMDADWYLGDPLSPRQPPNYPQFTESALYYDIAFDKANAPVSRPSYPTGRTMRDHWVRKRKLDLDSEMPDHIAQLLLDAIEETFYQAGDKHPKILQGTDGRPTIGNVKEAYKLLFRYLKLSTVDGFSHEKPEPPLVFPNLDFPTATDPKDSPPGDDSSDSNFFDDLLDFLLSVARVLAYIGEVVLWFATLPWAVLADLGTYPLRYALYYLLELPLYYVLKNFRSTLVQTGYLHPMDDEVDQSLVKIGNNQVEIWTQVRTQVEDPFGGVRPSGEGPPPTTFRDPKGYPHLNRDDDYKHPWEYPHDSPVEQKPTTTSPYPTASPYARDADPAMLFQAQQPDAVIRDGLETATSPDDADTIGLHLAPDRHMGDSVNLSKYLIWLASRADRGAVELVDWNLDADRGYGYHGWDWCRHPAGPEFPPKQDEEGNPFEQPCAWPSQADGLPSGDPGGPNVRDGVTPAKVHWDNVANPGCEPPPPPPIR